MTWKDYNININAQHTYREGEQLTVNLITFIITITSLLIIMHQIMMGG